MNDLSWLLEVAEKITKNKDGGLFSDGHFTVFKFTTGYKIWPGTPVNVDDIRNGLESLPAKMTLKQALKNYILRRMIVE